MGIALLTAMAVAFIYLPFLRARKRVLIAETEDRSQQNIEIFQERLAELDAEQRAGTLDDKEYATLKTELERNLLVDVEQAQDQTQEKQVFLTSQTLVTVTLLALLVPVSAIGLYSVFGHANELEISLQQPVDPFNGEQPTLEQAIAQLEKELQIQPNNPEGWFLLASTYMNQGRFADAGKGLEKVLEYLPPNAPQYANVMGQYAQMLFFVNDNKITSEVRQQIDKTLRVDPQEVTALGLLGIDAFEKEDYQAALDYWLTALRNADGQSADSLRTGVRNARDRLIEQGKAVPEIPELVDAEINLRVEVASQHLTAVSPSHDVFIFAREVGGRLPLAVVRLKVEDLPADIQLNDTQAMDPQARLSSASQVEIYARVSKSGQPQAQSGDIFTSIAPVSVRGNAAPLILSMDKVVE